jgi:O-acetyl-ADP-ribose deacetylase (regulator of RNase III)
MDILINETRVFVVSGELAKQAVDALVHPTNNYLWFSSGTSEGLKRFAGEFVETAAINAGPIEIGQAIITPQGRLKCKYLIHAAAWGQDMMTSVPKIHEAVKAALVLADKHHCVSLAIPPVGAEIVRFPVLHAVQTTFLTVLEHCLKTTTLREIRFLAADKIIETLLKRLIETALSAMPPGKSGAA